MATEQERQRMLNAPKINIKVIEARNLKAADWGGTSDPFVELRIRNQTKEYKTKVIQKTLSPFWNEEFILHPTSVETDHISLKVYDWDSNSNNDLLGEIEIPVALVANQPVVDKWYQVMRKTGPTSFVPSKGEVKLSITFVQPGMPPQNPQFAQPPPQQPQYPPPQQQYPPPQYPPQQQYPPPQQQYPPQQYPPQQYPPQQYPPQQYPPQQYPPQQYPPQQYPPQPYGQYPPQQYPPQQYPPQPYGQYQQQYPGQYPQMSYAPPAPPKVYNPPGWTYTTAYNPRAQFIIPMGCPPHLQAKMMQASAIFRMYDRDCSGQLDKREWKKAMKHLGYPFSKGQAKQMFFLVDKDHSGTISEREFCEFWVQWGI